MREISCVKEALKKEEWKGKEKRQNRKTNNVVMSLQEGSLCSCGNTYGRYGYTTECTTDCIQMSPLSMWCGGTNRNFVYYVNGEWTIGKVQSSKKKAFYFLNNVACEDLQKIDTNESFEKKKQVNIQF